MKQQEFQLMWEAHDMGFFWGEMVANDFAKVNLYKKQAGLIENNIIFYYQNDIGSQFYNKITEMKRAADFGYKRFTDNSKAKQYLDASRLVVKRANKDYNDRLNFNYSSFDNEQLLNELKNNYDLFLRVYTYYHACQPQYFYKIEEGVQKYLADNLPKNKINEVYGILTAAKNPDPIQIEELAWLKIVTQAKNSSINDVKDQIIKHADKYVYFGTIESNTPWDQHYFLNKIKDDIKHNHFQEIDKLEGRGQKIIKDKARVIKKYNISRQISDICNNLSQLGNNRLYLRGGWSQTGHIITQIHLELVKRNTELFSNLSVLLSYSLDELINLIIGGKNILARDLKDRQQAYCYHVVAGKISVLVGKQAIIYKEKLIPVEKYSIKKFEGVVGYRGKVRGRVIKFTWLEEDLAKKMAEMKKGDILVAGQTRPFLMPAIRKSSAIITDEGGITSHVAIVSRELKIPCVMGTKIATKVLKDGDLVEVDAERGIVTILK